MNVEIIYTTKDYTTTYDIIRNADHAPTLAEWLDSIDNADEWLQAKEAIKKGHFTFIEVPEVRE